MREKALSGWSPEQYLKYREPRLRPALDLLARIALESPERVVDLGCGAGNVTRILARRWPNAQVLGVDGSSAMLSVAERELVGDPESESLGGRIAWQEADIAWWIPDAPPDLIFSNAALHWLDDHPRLFPRLLKMLSSGGWLAVQMPNNFSQPTHQAIFQAVREGPWRDRLSGLMRESPVMPPEAYHALLSVSAQWVEVWETVYFHPLTGENPVLEWIRGSVLKPYLDALAPEWVAPFTQLVADFLRHAYPRRADGVTLLPFRRVFLLAQNRSSLF